MGSENETQCDGNTSFLRAARAGNLEKVLEFLKSDIDINTCNANGLNALHLASKDGHLQVVTELLKRGAAVDTATKKGNTALHIASLAGQEDIVKILLHHNASVNVQSQNGFTPLYMAAQENHDAVVKLLLTNGANQGLATEDGFTPLAVAMQQGHDKVVTVLLESDTRGKVRLPALHIAAKKDDVRAATLLLDNDHNPDVTSKSGFTPLHIASHYGNEAIANILIQKGANVNYFAKHNISPLHVAAKWGKTNLVSLLLEKGGCIGNKTRDGLTPLHCAARSGHEQVVDMLLERGAPISAKTKNGLTPLHMAAQGEHIDAARILLYHRAPVDEVTIDYLTALHVAAHCGHVRVAKLLLDRSADPNARALNGFTPLHIACKKNRIKVVELLLKHGASIGATTESGLTPLHVASFMGCMNIVIYLLQHEACPDVPTVRGETPLHLAARANQTDIIRILLRNGALVDARAREQQTPLHIAARLGNVDNVMLLLQHGAHVDSTTKDMYTALHIAVKEGQDEVAGVLIENGASLEATTKKGFTSLHLAAKYSHTKVAKLLLQKDAAVDAQGKNGVTPLHVASHYDNHCVALMLLERGASPHSIAKNGHTPLHIAARKNQMDIATTLLEYGANADAESKAGFTPLHLCSQEGNSEMSSILLEHKANMNHPAKNGLTPMHLCAQEDMVNVAKVLVQKGANIELTTRAGYTPLHVAAHFGQAQMVRYLLMNGAKVDVATSIGYTPLHQAAQQGHSHIVNILIEHNANPNLKTSNGQTALHIADRLGYISVLDSLKAVTSQSLPSTQEEKYRVVAPETMHETFMSDSEEEGGEDILLSDQPYRYLTVDEMKSLGDDSLPIDVTRDERLDSNRMAQTADSSSNSPQTTESIICPQRISTFSADKVTTKHSVKDNDVPNHKSTERIGFLVSFMVDARGGAMRGCRHSGVRMIIPSQTAFEPTRITCRYVKHQRTIHPPQLMEGEALASRILELGPAGTKFLGPVILELPHFASLRGKEREIVILRSDNGETWREHNVENSEEIIHDILHQSFETEDTRKLDEMFGGGRVCRFVSYDIPVYVAVVSRIRQEVHAIGPEGGMVSSTVVAQVQAVFPQGALTKKIKVGLQAQPIDPDLTAKLLGRGVAVSPIVTVEPRRRKFHKAITLNMPAPKAHSQGMINQYAGNAPTLRLLCSITGGASRAQWEDVTGSTPLTFVNDCVSFTTTVSARFWLMDCRNISEATRMAAELYREAIHVPFIANFAVYGRRVDACEAQLRVFCITDDKPEKTLEYYEHFTEVAKSRDVEVLEGKSQFIEIAGNLVAVTKSGDQLQLPFNAFRENRLPFSVRVKDQHADVVGRTLFMREPKIPKGEQPQQPICILNIVLPKKTPWEKNVGLYDPKNLVNGTTGPCDPEGLNLFGDLRTVDISNLLGEDWKPLAVYLGFTGGEVEAIQEQNPMSTAHQAQAMIRQFLNKNKNDINILRSGLQCIGREDIIERSSQVLNRKTETIPVKALPFQDRVMDNLTEREEIKYSAEEKFVEDSDSDDCIEKKSVAERRQKIEKWLSEERQIPASTQKLEIVQEITEIKRKSLIEDKKAKHEEEIMLQMAANFKVKSSEVPDNFASFKDTKENEIGKNKDEGSEEPNKNLDTTVIESEKCFQNNQFPIPKKLHYEDTQRKAIASDSITPCDIQPQYEDREALPVTLDPKIEETCSKTSEDNQLENIYKCSITGYEKSSSSITKIQTEFSNVRESQQPRGQPAEECGNVLPNKTSCQFMVPSPRETIDDTFFPDSTEDLVNIEDKVTGNWFPPIKTDVSTTRPGTSPEMLMISDDTINDMKHAGRQVKDRYAIQLSQKNEPEYPKTVDSTTDTVRLLIAKPSEEVSTQRTEKRGLLGSISLEEIQRINIIYRNFGCGSKNKSDGELNKKYGWQKDVFKPSQTTDVKPERFSPHSSVSTELIDRDVRSSNVVRQSGDSGPAHRAFEQASFYIGESSTNIIKKSTSYNAQKESVELGGQGLIKDEKLPLADLSTNDEELSKSNSSVKETRDLNGELVDLNLPQKATIPNKLFRKDSETRNDILELDQPVEILHANSYKIEANSNLNTTDCINLEALKSEVVNSSQWEPQVSSLPVRQQMITEDARELQSGSITEETVERESEGFASFSSGVEDRLKEQFNEGMPLTTYDQAIDMNTVPKLSKSDTNFDKSEVEPSEKSFSKTCNKSVSSSHQHLSSPVESLHLNAFQLVADQIDESLVEKTFQEVEYSLDAVQVKLMEVVKDSEYIKQSPSEFEFKPLPQVSLDSDVIDFRLQDNIQSNSECTSDSLDSLQNEVPVSLRSQPASSLQSGVLDASVHAPNQSVTVNKSFKEHKSESSSHCSGPGLDQSSSDSPFQSFEKSNSRPCSSDVENLITHGNFSEYQTACDVSSPFQQGSTEYMSAVSTLDCSNKTISSHESMRSLDSENSANLGSVELSEISETLVPLVDEGDYDEEAELDCDDVAEFPELKNNFTLIFPNNISKDDFGMRDTSQVQSMMKRSQEMTFALDEGRTLETTFLENKFNDSLDKSESRGVPEQYVDSFKEEESGREPAVLITNEILKAQTAAPNQLRDSLIEDLEYSGKNSFLENEKHFPESNPNTTLTQATIEGNDGSSLDSKQTHTPLVEEESSPYESEYKHAYKVPSVKAKCVDTSNSAPEKFQRAEEQLISPPDDITEASVECNFDMTECYSKQLAQSMQVISNNQIETIGKTETDPQREKLHDEDLSPIMAKQEFLCFEDDTEDARTQKLNITDEVEVQKQKQYNSEHELSFDKTECFDGGERDGFKPDSPDSFEMLEQPDLSDDFVIIEEVAKEASEFDMEGKGIRIKSINYVKKHDDEVEKIIVKSAPAAPNEGSLMYMHAEGLNFHFEESPPTPHDQTEAGTIDTQNMNKKWVEMQLSDNATGLRYPYEVERGILEDIKEEDVEGDFPSSRLSSYKDSFSSTPDYDMLVGRRRVTREQDEVSMNSLQEFENLEQAISLENRRYRQRDDSQDSLSNGSLTRRYLVRCGGQGDDTSLSSLKEFEGLENACIEAHLIEIKAKEEAALLLSRSNDSSKSDSDTGRPNKMRDASVVVASTQSCSVNMKSVEASTKLQTEPEPDLILDSRSVSVKDSVNFEVSQQSKLLAEGEKRDQNFIKISADRFKGEVSKETWFQEGSLVRSCESMEVCKSTADPMITSADSLELNKDLSVRSSHSEMDSLEQLPTQSIRSYSVDSIKHIYSNPVRSSGLPDISGKLNKAPLPNNEFSNFYTENALLSKFESSEIFEQTAKEHSCDSLNLNQTESDRLVNSTDSLNHTSSSATNATCQNEIDSMMSGSITSCGSNTLVEYLEVTFAEAPHQSTCPSSQTLSKGLKATKLTRLPTDHHKSANVADGSRDDMCDESKKSDDKTDEKA